MDSADNDLKPEGVGASLLESLPPELLHRVFGYIIPQSFNFSFSYTKVNSELDVSAWTLFAARGKGLRIAIVNKPSHLPRKEKLCRTCTAQFCDIFMLLTLSYVSKNIATAVRANFFRNNVFSFRIDGEAQRPRSLKSPLIFGPLGAPHLLHLLRDLQRIHLTLEAKEMTPYSATRLRARTQHFVDILQQHAGNVNKQSRLKELRVHLCTEGSMAQMGDSPDWDVGDMLRIVRSKGCTMREYYMFTLEPLASVLGISTVNVSGVSAWFRACLEKRICGGAELATVNWPAKLVKRQLGKGTKRRRIEVERTTREGWQPVFDWRAFAIRNNISVPDNISSFFPA